MARADRLFTLLDLLRRLPAPVTAARMAAETEVSERSIYRDIATLRASGARIEGEPGYGYALTEDPALPPQMFSRIEVEALVLGLAEVQHSGDQELSDAAQAAFAKITASLPERVQRQAMHSVMHVYRSVPRRAVPGVSALLRQACWDELAVDISYVDKGGKPSQRRVLPLNIVYHERLIGLMAWCELRQDFRHFILERIVEATLTEQSFRPRRVPLLREFVERLRALDKQR